MTWATVFQIALALSALFTACFKLYTYLKGRKDMERQIMMKSAEECAKASQKIAEAARKAANETAKYGPDTRVSDGNKLLSGNEFGKGR